MNEDIEKIRYEHDGSCLFFLVVGSVVVLSFVAGFWFWAVVHP